MACAIQQVLLAGGVSLAVAATAVTDTPTASSSLTINLPSGITAGDLLLIVVSLQANGRISSNVPTGFTRIGAVQGQDNVGEFAIFRKTATGSEGSTVAMSLAGSTTGGCVALRVVGWTGTPEKASNATSDPPSLTPSWGSAATLWLAVYSIGYTSQPTITYPTNYTSNTVESANGRAAVGWRVLPAASEDPGSFGTTGGSGVHFGSATVAVQPAV